jgi:hypothetical protein
VLGEILRSLHASGIQTLALKDVWLAVDSYPDRALRPLGDLDLLVHRDQYRDAAEQLAARGFLPVPDAEKPYAARYAMAQHFRRAADGIWIDLQWNVAQREWDLYGEGSFTYDVAGMWRRARPASIDGVRVLVPSPEDMLLHLCLHLEGHAYAELILFSDLVELLRRHGDEFDWQAFVAAARLQSAEASAYWVLLMLQRLFGVGPPAEALGALRGPWFQGDLLDSIFGSLGPLHSSLDQIHVAARPPQGLLDRLEAVVRRQTSRAMRLYSEIDGVASSFVRGGGRFILLSGDPPERVWPDPSLRAFGELSAFILDEDLPLLREALLSNGFREHGGAVPWLAKRCTITSADPALAGECIELRLEAVLVREVAAVPDEPGAFSNRHASVESLKRRLGRATPDDSDAGARLVFYALPPEELLVVGIARLAMRSHHRLLGLCNLIELIRAMPRTLDWHRVHEIAQHLSAEEGAAVGLATLKGVLDPVERAQLEDEASPLPPRAPARILEFGRYGPQALERYPGLRNAFLYVFCLLQVAGLRAQAGYVYRSFRGSSGSPAVVPRLLVDLARTAMGRLARPRPETLRAFAYWIEDEPRRQA